MTAIYPLVFQPLFKERIHSYIRTKIAERGRC